MSTIEHNAEQFRHSLARHLGGADQGGIMAAVDVTTRDSNPSELVAIVADPDDPERWYSSGKTYTSYQHAFTALGAAIDAINPQRAPLSWNF
jgi:hypothetical protein